MDTHKYRIKIYVENSEIIIYEGYCFFYYDDNVKQNYIHFRDAEGKHHRIYNVPVIIDEL